MQFNKKIGVYYNKIYKFSYFIKSIKIRIANLWIA